MITKRELELAGSCLREGKALVIGLNKLDALSHQQAATVTQALQVRGRARGGGCVGVRAAWLGRSRRGGVCV